MKPDQANPLIPVVGIGSSAGGLEALRVMFSAAEIPTGLAFAVVQHLDPHHESMLAELVGRHTQLSVRQCEGDETIEPDTVFIIPPGRGLSIQGGRLLLTDFEQPRGLRRPIDDFFVSLASDQQSNAACVILSGTGADGTTGLRAIKENGGLCVVQDPETAKYDGMPLSATSTGLVDYVLPPDQIISCIGSFFSRKNQSGEKKQASLVPDHVDDLCRILRNVVGHDFSGYKRSTFVRRVERRMHVLGIDHGTEYLARVQQDASECDALFRDLLINVTRFFRDKDSFKALRDRVVVPLLEEAVGSEDGVRIWVPGCSSGEEAYSIAMLFADAASKLQIPCNVQIFATDIDESMLKIARTGSYPISALADIPQDLQEHFVIPHKERFNFIGQIRDMIRFSGHSVVKDPPFSKVDLVSCRNLLIYFDDKLQKTVMPLLHYAIRPGGYLFLGSSESIGRFDTVFANIDQKARLFERLPGTPTYPIPLPGERRDTRPKSSQSEERQVAQTIENVAAARLMERYVPASVVLDDNGQILAAYGRLSRFFEFPVSGSNETSATALARPGIKEQLGPLVRQAKDAKKRVVARQVNVVTDFGLLKTEIVCDPLDGNAYLIVFQEATQFTPLDAGELIELEPGDGHVEALERELRSAKHRLRSATEELETANEELKSSNEEMMSMNEELQSTNEELTTVNDELKNKVDEITVANTDLRNFFESTNLAVIVLNRALQVRSYTRAATEIFPLRPTDQGRHISDVATRLLKSDYLTKVRTVMEDGVEHNDTISNEDRSKTFTLRILPYRLPDGSIDGATIVLTDITHALAMERQLAAEQDRHNFSIAASGIGIWEFIPSEGHFHLRGSGRDLFHTKNDDPTLNDLLSGLSKADREKMREAFVKAEDQHEAFEITTQVDVNGSSRWVKTFGQFVEESLPARIIGVSVDVTAENELAEARELMLNEMNHRVKNLFAMIAGILRIAARKHETTRSLVDDVETRIIALGNAHTLASNRRRTNSLEMHELVAVMVSPYMQQSNVRISRAPLPITAPSVTPLTLILHEWTTNAVKHGVLGKEEGALTVDWHRSADRICLRWNEKGASTVMAPGAAGFGSILLATAARQIGAKIDTEIDGVSLSHVLDMPVSVMNDE